MMSLKKTAAAIGLATIAGLTGCHGHCGSNDVCNEEIPCECQQGHASMYPTYQSQPQYQYTTPSHVQPAPTPYEHYTPAPSTQPGLTTPPAPGPINPAPPAAPPEPTATEASSYRIPGTSYPGRSYHTTSMPYESMSPARPDSVLHRMGDSMKQSFQKLTGRNDSIHQTSQVVPLQPTPDPGFMDLNPDFERSTMPSDPSQARVQVPQQWPYHHAAQSGLIVPR